MNIQRLRYRLSHLAEEYHRRSWIRAAVLSTKARGHTQRFLSPGCRRFVLFLVPGRDIVNGGVMSIFSIAEEMQKITADRGVSTAICTAYSEPRILRYTKFDNSVNVLALSDLLPRLPANSDVMVHIPEMWVKPFGTDCLPIYQSRTDLHWHFNILLQNIDRIPEKDAVGMLARVGRITATAAHKAYASDETAQRLGCPVHHLSTWVSPEAYERLDYSRKQKLIVVSPDWNPARVEILRNISKALPDHKIVEIRNMTYRQYRDLIKIAKFAFTFGEGLDGYFMETIFSGGVSMAIYNQRYFTPEYADLDGVFANTESAISDVGPFLNRANCEEQYREIGGRQFNVGSKQYVRTEYLKNIRQFCDVYLPG